MTQSSICCHLLLRSRALKPKTHSQRGTPRICDKICTQKHWRDSAGAGAADPIFLMDRSLIIARNGAQVDCSAPFHTDKTHKNAVRDPFQPRSRASA
jgi:hypothetical protein